MANRCSGPAVLLQQPLVALLKEGQPQSCPIGVPSRYVQAPRRRVSSQAEAGYLSPRLAAATSRHNSLPCLLPSITVTPLPGRSFPLLEVNARLLCQLPEGPLTPHLPAGSSCPFLGVCSAPTRAPAQLLPEASTMSPGTRVIDLIHSAPRVLSRWHGQQRVNKSLSDKGMNHSFLKSESRGSFKGEESLRPQMHF